MSRIRTSCFAVGSLVVPVVVSACAGSVSFHAGNSSASESPAKAQHWTCERLADDAVRVSHANHGDQPEMLKVQSVQLVADHQKNPPTASGADRVLLLDCKGVGVFDDAKDRTVSLKLTANAQGERFVRYDETLSTP